jgi:hypothetical protein
MSDVSWGDYVLEADTEAGAREADGLGSASTDLGIAAEYMDSSAAGPDAAA